MAQSLENRLVAGLEAMSVTVAPEAVRGLLEYLDLLTRWNATYNLTAVRDPEEMVAKHLLDSLSVAPFVRGKRLADVGAGAGLPGLPLAIRDPNLAVTLIEANGKKARFLREAVRVLGLRQVSVAQQRVEALSGAFDSVISRAFSSLADFVALAAHLLVPGGRLLAMKGKRPDDEMAQLPSGYAVESVHEVFVPGLDAERHLVVIRQA